MAKIESIRELLVEELRDLHSAEEQIIDALPKLADKAGSDDLREGLLEHLEDTKSQAIRLEALFEYLGEKPGGAKCEGIEGIIKEGEKLVKRHAGKDIMDVAIIAAARKVEHYEMAGYMSAKEYANLLGDQAAAGMIDEILQEEQEADKKLEKLGRSGINLEAPLE